MNKAKVEQFKQDRGVEGPRDGCDGGGKTGFIREEGPETEARVVFMTGVGVANEAGFESGKGVPYCIHDTSLSPKPSQPPSRCPSLLLRWGEGSSPTSNPPIP